MRVPFTAARARNVGFKRLLAIAPRLTYVHFVDGDCEVNRQAGWNTRSPSWKSIRILARCVGVCASAIRSASVYNWLCDRDWDRPVGEAAPVVVM